MAAEKAIEDRMIGLETYIANQEAVIQDLSDAVARQWEVIDKLSATMEQIKERFLGLEEAVRSGQGLDKPPHY